MIDWWGETDNAILDCLRHEGAMSPGELGRQLAISEGEATAFLAMLAREGKVRLRLVELSRHSLGEEGTAGRLPVDVDRRAGRPMPTRALARMATTGIYLVRGVPLDLQRAARGRAVSAGTTLRQVLLQGLREYAAGTWTPQPDGKLTELKSASDLPQGLDRSASQR